MALKISNTTVIDNTRQLLNIAAVDADSYHFLQTHDYIPTDATFTVLTTAGSGTWTKTGGSGGDYVVAYLVGGGGSGCAARNITTSYRAYAEGGHSGAAGIVAFGYGAMASTVNYTVGDGGAAVTATTSGASYYGNMGGDTVFAGYGVGGKEYRTKMGLATTEGQVLWSNSTDLSVEGGYVDNSYMYDGSGSGSAYEIKYSEPLAVEAGNQRLFIPSTRKPNIRTSTNGGNLPYSKAIITSPGSPAVVGISEAVRTGYNRTYSGGVFPQTGTGGNGIVGTIAGGAAVTAQSGNNYGAGGGGALHVTNLNATSGAGARGCIIIMIMPGAAGVSSAASATIRIPSFGAVVDHVSSNLGILPAYS